MSVTVEDLLQLPSLRHAEVIAGRGGLKKIVSSISVMEAADPAKLNDSLFHNDEFCGSEIAITGFMSALDDVDLQCRSIRRLAEVGEVGLILYYVGVYLKQIDPSLIKLADELDFTLICMPRNRDDLRYSEVICEVMGAIIKDQHAGTSIVVDILDRVAKLPQYQQTVDTVVKMLSDRLHATVIVTDSHLRVLNEAAWPRTMGGLHAHLKGTKLPEPSGPAMQFCAVHEGLLYRESIKSEGSAPMNLFLVREREPLSKSELQQAAESVQLAVSLWSQHHERAVVAELVKSIILDEPLKMRRIADLLNIDIAAAYVMWAFSGSPFNASHADIAVDCAKRYCKNVISDIYDGYLVLFMDGPESLSDISVLFAAIAEQLPKNAVCSAYTNLENTADVRRAYLANKEYLADARVIMPCRNWFTGADIAFARNCRSRIASGEDAVMEALAPLGALHRRRYAEDLELTLACFLLDSDMNMQITADRLFLHKNTIKYRMRCISDCFGFDVGQMPGSYMLYEAIAIKRMLDHSGQPTV